MDVQMGPDGFARVLSHGENGLNFIQCADDGCATKSTGSFPYDGYSGYATGISLAVAADGVPSMEIGSWIGDTQSVDYIRCTNADCSGYSDQTVPGTWGNPYEISMVLGTDGAARMIAQASDGTVSRQDCKNSISVTVDDNPSAYNNTFTQGTTQ